MTHELCIDRGQESGRTVTQVLREGTEHEMILLMYAASDQRKHVFALSTFYVRPKPGKALR